MEQGQRLRVSVALLEERAGLVPRCQSGSRADVCALGLTRAIPETQQKSNRVIKP